jgi:hypothetical protein
MNTTLRKSSRTVKTLRWFTRIFGVISVLVFLVFFVADCVKKGTIAVEGDRIGMTVFLFVTIVGLIIAWKWEWIGGIMALFGLIGFDVSAPESLARPAVLFMTVMYGLPALLFLFCWWMSKRQGVSNVA